MKPRTSPFLVNLSFASAILILIAIFTFAGVSLRGLIESNERVSHTLIVLSKLDETLAHIANAESGVYGYIITGDETFLDPYFVALDPQKGVNAHLAELRQLTADNPGQQARLDRFERLINNKMAILRQYIELRQQEGFEAAQALAASKQGRDEIESIRALIGEMQEEEFALLQTRSDAASKSLQYVLWVSAIGAPLTLALMTATFFLLWRQIRERRRAEENLRHLNADLDRRVTERTHELAESERNYRDLADSALVGIYRTTLKGEIQYVNKALARMMGFDSPAELIRDGNIVHYRDPADRQALIEKLQRDGKVESYETVLLNKSGEPLDVLLSAQINGDIITGTILDISKRKRTEDALRRSETLLLQTGKMAKIGGWEIDWQTMTPTLSAEARRIHEVDPSFKFDLEKAINFYAPEVRPAVIEATRQATEEGKAFDLELPFITAKGNRIWVRSMGEAEFQNGKCVRLFGTFQDITERKRREEALRRSEALLLQTGKMAKVGGWELDVQTMALTWSSETYRIHEVDPSLKPDLENAINFYAPEARPIITEAVRQAMEEGKAYDLELPFITAKGNRIWVRAVGEAEFQDGKCVRLFGTFQDITERKQAEEDRMAREMAERASQAKSEFLSRMSHEFRTPLNAILGFAQLLKMEQLAPAQERGVEQIYKSGRHLLDLVNEVLDIARIEAGRMTVSPEAVRVEDAVNETFDLIRPMAEARRLSLTLKIPSSSDVFVEADRQRFKQVLLNLLSNAVKYNREGGSILVTASLTIDGHLRLQVRDSGEGIPPEKMERLFVPFDRLDTTSNEGTGLGLALSKGLIEAMGGRIGAESKVGEGSAFWIELKLVTDRLKEAIMAEVEEHLTEKIRKGRGLVLYVEDNLANVKLVEAIMERIPEVKLITAMQGRLAMDLAKEHQPDLILLDLHLPDMHGSEALRRLKAEPATQNIPVVIISADAMPAHVNDLLALGAKSYLTKPIDVKEFLKVIEEHM